jgi:hypothetical protein
MIRTQMQLYDEQVEWLKKQAVTEGRSMSQIIRDSVDSYRKLVEKAMTLSSKKKNALRAVGSFSSEKKAEG